MQAAMQQGVVAPAPAPAPAPAEDVEEQTVKESNQLRAAISTWEWTANEFFGKQACLSDHNAPDLKGQPVNITDLFKTTPQGDIQSCLKLQEIEVWGAQGY